MALVNAGDHASVPLANREFHAAINDATGNPGALPIVDSHWLLLSALLKRYGYGEERFPRVIEEHQHLIDANRATGCALRRAAEWAPTSRRPRTTSCDARPKHGPPRPPMPSGQGRQAPRPGPADTMDADANRWHGAGRAWLARKKTVKALMIREDFRASLDYQVKFFMELGQIRTAPDLDKATVTDLV